MSSSHGRVAPQRTASSRRSAPTYSATGTTRRTAIAKSQYEQRRAQKGTWTYAWRGGAARREVVDDRTGRLGYYVAGEGPPVLLVHSINAAGSAYEVGPIFGRLSARRRTYAVDLPGFGTSDRSERRYDVRLYADAIHAMLDVIAADAGWGYRPSVQRVKFINKAKFHECWLPLKGEPG